MLEQLFSFISQIISSTGYIGICVFMVLESMIFPIPSEAVMPFAGFLIHKQFSWLGVFIASSLGSLIGSYLSYWIGKYGGKPFLQKYGKYFLIKEKELQKAEEFVQKYGDKAVLLCRFIPVIRHFSSIPAGTCHMPLGKFFLFTFIGASSWNMFLAYIGYVFHGNLEHIHQYKHYIDYIGVGLALIFIIFLIIRHHRSLINKIGCIPSPQKSPQSKSCPKTR